MRSYLMIALAAALLAVASSNTYARTAASHRPPSTTQRATPFSGRQTPQALGSRTPIPGGIIGDRRTLIYHLAGDMKNLPPAKDRIYFRSQLEARAAGYRPARPRPLQMIVPSLPPSDRPTQRPPASPLSRDQTETAPTTPMPNP